MQNNRTLKVFSSPTLIGLLLVGLCMGCEDEIAPFTTTEFPFTIWGLVNPTADTQAVRVFTIDTTLELIPSENLDATTSIINVDRQERTS